MSLVTKPRAGYCEEEVMSGWQVYQCNRKAVIERDGHRYCKQHDPEAVKARRAVSNARYQATWDAQARASKIKQLKDEIVKYAALWSVDPYYEPQLREAILAFRVADTEEALRSLSVEGVVE